MFDSLYPEAADAAIEAKANRAPDPVAPTPWFKGGWSAVGKALPRAGAEMARALTAPMTPEAAAALSSPSMFSAPQTTPSQATSELRQQDSAIRDAIKEMTPDANSTGAAAMILHDVTRFVGKAAAYGVAGGAPGAVIGMGLDEGYNEAARRMDEGVDPTTAAKLGVVKGVSSAVAVALPVAGRTIGQTLALAAGGGPGTFIAEQVTAREILANADYTKEAADIDPFDPLGLGVSFFGSLIFGAGALGARRMRAKADAKAADAQAMAADTPPGQPTEVARAARVVTQEQVDAAHVSELQTHREASGLHAPEDVAARAEHVRALDEATTQLATGQRVSVAEVAPVDAARIEAEVMPRLQAAVRRLELFHGTKDPEVTVDTLSITRDIGPHFTTARATAELFANSEGTPGRVLEARGEFANPLELPDLHGWFPTNMAEAIDEALGTAQRAEDGQTQLQARVWAAMEQVRKDFLDAQPEWYQKARNEFGNKSPEQLARESEVLTAASAKANEAGYAVLREHLADQGVDAIKYINRSEGEPVDTYIALDRSKVRDASAEPAPAAQPSTVKQEQGTVKQEEGAGVDQPSADFVAREADTIAQTDPDLMVMMEGMDQPVRASELLAEAKAMAEQEIADAPLMKVAAECALRG